MKLALTLVLIAMIEGWATRAINDHEFVIENNTSRGIICYIYYLDGDYKKTGVRAHSDSRPFSRYGLDNVECF